jgi:ATP-dependent Lhr-like helicase
MEKYSGIFLDELCFSGQVAWGRLFPPTNGDGRKAGPTRSSPVSIMLRQDLSHWLAIAPHVNGEVKLSGLAEELRAHLERQGASFFQELVHATRRLPTEVRNALGELVAAGLITGDGFAGLRGLISAGRSNVSKRRPPKWFGVAQPSALPAATGRWSLFRTRAEPMTDSTQAAEFWARQLLRRYGIVFFRVAQRETGLPQWRDVLRVYRRMEARGDIRGGRFVDGFTGEQYALPEAVEAIRAIRRAQPDGRLVGISAADPLNLVGIATPGEKVPALAGNRIVFRDGAPIATRVAGAVSYLTDVAERERPLVLAALRG